MDSPTSASPLDYVETSFNKSECKRIKYHTREQISPGKLLRSRTCCMILITAIEQRFVEGEPFQMTGLPHTSARA